jgi:uncharacterized protein YceH (UPF0502 family)
LHKFSDVTEVETELESLATRDEPLVLKLPREPGKREPRYAHLFSGKPHAQSLSTSDGEEIEATGSDRERLAALEKQVHELQLGLEELRQKILRSMPE